MHERGVEMKPVFTAAILIGCATSWTIAHDSFDDPAGDAMPRRTDPGAEAPIISPGNLPDITGMELGGWLPDNPEIDPYTGIEDTSNEPDLLRIALKFAGLVNPPGPLGLSGLPHEPDRFGPSPVYGFVEFDVDDDPDSGGEDRAVAVNRFLANAARFGSVLSDDDYERMVLRPGDADQGFGTSPQFERTGAEFAIAMCGCWDLVVLDEGVAPDGVFDPGDTWLVEGRFLERAQGFDCLSFVFGNAGNGGPSGFGLYDPVTEARFSHDPQANETTIELVFPLTPAGAASLTGEPVQPLDFTFGGGNHFSIEEALNDLQLGAMTASGICGVLAGEWYEIDLHPDAGEPVRPLDPSTWESRAIIGTAYATEQPDAIYAWTDVAFGDQIGDVNGTDGVDDDDRSEIISEIESLDGTASDADGQADGVYTYTGLGPVFSLFDLDYDGVVGPGDLALVPFCAADIAEPFGTLDLADISAFISGFIQNDPVADMNGDGLFDLTDITLFIDLFTHGCTS